MPGVAGEVKVIFSADTASYTASVKAAKQQLGVFEQSATSAGKVAREQFSEARGSVMVLGEEIGVHLPRHVQAFIAKLPGVASAMSSAFSAIAIVAIGKAIFEAGEKVYEFAKKNEEAAAKNAAAWRAVEGPLHQTNSELAIANSKLQDSIDELSKKPGDGIRTALLEASDAAEKLADKLDADVQKMRELGKGGSMQALTSLVTNKAPSDQLDRMIGFLGKTFQSVTAEYEEVKTRAAEAGDWQNYKDQSQLEVNALQEKLGPTFNSLHEYIREQENAQGADPYGPDRSANIAKAKAAFDVITNAVLAIAQEADRASGTINERQLRNAAFSGGPVQPLFPDWGNYYPGYFRAAAATAAPSKLPPGAWNWAAQYSSPVPVMGPTGGLNPQQMSGMFSPAANVIGPNAKTAGPFDAFVRSLDDAAKEFTNLNAILATFTLTTLNNFNETLMKTLSTPENMLRGQHPWRNLGASTAESAGSAALKFGEGEVMKGAAKIPFFGGLFGGGKKPSGTQSDPLYVVMSSTLGAGASSVLGGLFSSSSASSAASTAASSIGMGASALLDALPHFAEGGMIPSNVPSIVGENGPELFMPSTSGRIAPSGSFGGSSAIHIDARGSNDPAAVNAAVHRAMGSYLPHISGLAVSAMHDNNRRIPMTKNRI